MGQQIRKFTYKITKRTITVENPVTGEEKKITNPNPDIKILTGIWDPETRKELILEELDSELFMRASGIVVYPDTDKRGAITATMTVEDYEKMIRIIKESFKANASNDDEAVSKSKSKNQSTIIPVPLIEERASTPIKSSISDEARKRFKQGLLRRRKGTTVEIK